MNPDFIIAEKHTAEGSIFIVLPTNVSMLNWMFARVTEDERRKMSAHLSPARFEEFKQLAEGEGLMLTNPSVEGIEGATAQVQ